MAQRWSQGKTANRETEEELQEMGTNGEIWNREHSRTGEEDTSDVIGAINIRKQGTVGDCVTLCHPVSK